MARYLIIKGHRPNDPVHFMALGDVATDQAVTAFQRELRQDGRTGDGVTYQVHDGDMVSAMIGAAALDSQASTT